MNSKASLLTTEKITLLLSLIPYLVDHGPTPVTQLANRFSVDADTIRSLVRFLGTAGIPGDTATYQHEDLFDIDWDALELRDEAVITKTIVVDDVPRLSPREVSALLAGLQLLRSLPNLASGAEIEMLTRKLSGVSAATPPRVDVAPRPVPSDLERLHEAVASGYSVTFTYRDVDGNTSTRRVQPHLIETVDSVWYLHGWCAERRADRVFRVDRMSELGHAPQLVEAPQHDLQKTPNAPRFVLNPESALEVSLRVSEGRVTALRAFDLWVTPSSRGRSASDSQRSGTVIGSVTLAVPGRAPHLVKAAPGSVEVLSPAPARMAVADWASRALAQYDV